MESPWILDESGPAIDAKEKERAASKIVGCIKVPGKEKYYVCFTDDYRVIRLDTFFRSRARPPKPPERICRLPDIFRDLGEPSRFAKAVGVPCRLTVPCVVYYLENDVEKALDKVDDEVCTHYMEDYPPPEDAYADSTLNVLTELMDYAKYHSKFGENVYRTCVFIGKTKAYAAPWTADRLIFDTMRALIEIGLLDKKFEDEIALKYKALELASIIGAERFGRIYDVGFNFYEHNGRLEAVAMFWVRTDKVARRYALRLWDIHFNYTMKIVETMNNLPDGLRLFVENYRNWKVLGVPYWRTYFADVKGIDKEEVQRIAEESILIPPVSSKQQIEDLGPKLYQVMKEIFKEVFGIDLDDEDEEQTK